MYIQEKDQVRKKNDLRINNPKHRRKNKHTILWIVKLNRYK
jgi:hypothetical protein